MVIKISRLFKLIKYIDSVSTIKKCLDIIEVTLINNFK